MAFWMVFQLLLHLSWLLPEEVLAERAWESWALAACGMNVRSPVETGKLSHAKEREGTSEVLVSARMCALTEVLNTLQLRKKNTKFNSIGCKSRSVFPGCLITARALSSQESHASA